MSYYFVAQIKIRDEKEYHKYLEKVDDVFEKYNGRYLAVDNSPRVLEGRWYYSRSVLIEFPSEKEFEDWYFSDEYREIMKHRLKAADCDTILIRSLH